MNPDNYQQAWQEHSSQTRVTVDAGLLLKELQRSQRAFRATIFIRDFREIAVAMVMLPLWFFLGITLSLPWTWYLTVPALVWVAGFMLVYRMRHKQDSSKPDDAVLHCVQRSLTEHEDQIWLLRNIFWWYLLPPTISILAFFAHVAWLSRSGGWLAALIFFVGLAGDKALIHRVFTLGGFKPAPEIQNLCSFYGCGNTVSRKGMPLGKSEFVAFG